MTSKNILIAELDSAKNLLLYGTNLECCYQNIAVPASLIIKRYDIEWSEG
jgi:hypothetical protein